MMQKLWAIIVAFFSLPLFTDQTGQFNLAALLPKLGGGIQPRRTVSASQGYRMDVIVEHGDAPFDTAAEVFALVGAVNIWHRIWEMTIPAQQAVHWGYGSPATPMNQGYMWFYLASAAAFDVGILRLIQENARRTNTIVVGEFADQGLHAQVAAVADASLISKDDMTALPEKVEHPLVGEDSRIALEYYPTVVVVETQAVFKIPITVYQ